MSAMTHTGFQKFGDLQIESKEAGFTEIVQLASRADLVIDLESSADFNCYYSWDNVSEDTVEINGTVTSNVINFDNKVLTDYTSPSQTELSELMTLVKLSTQIRDLNSSLLLRLIHPLISITRSFACYRPRVPE